MKKAIIWVLALVLAIPVLTYAQQPAKAPVWAELKKFHGLMSSSFHPAEEGNFAPLRAKADSMFMVAQAWQESAIPSNYKVEETKAALKELVIRVAAVRKAVEANRTDADLKKLIVEAHEAFHKIVGECRKEDGDHH